jgi:hypothetical protein
MEGRVEPSVGVSLVAELVNEVVVVKLQQLHHFWKHTILHSRAFSGELVQKYLHRDEAIWIHGLCTLDGWHLVEREDAGDRV